MFYPRGGEVLAGRDIIIIIIKLPLAGAGHYNGRYFIVITTAGDIFVIMRNIRRCDGTGGRR